MQWYYSKNGAQLGPIGSAEMQSKLVSGDISPTDLVWREGMTDWLPAGQVAELQALIAPPAERPSFETPTAPAAPYAAPVHAVVTGPPSQGMAIASLVCGILSLVTWCLWCLSGPLALVAVVLGHVALGRAKALPERFAGRGMAKTGVITGYLGLLAAIAMMALGFYMQSLTPERIERMDFLPPEVRESFNKQLELQQRLKESQQ